MTIKGMIAKFRSAISSERVSTAASSGGGGGARGTVLGPGWFMFITH